jgi:hypothetical protein
MISLQVRRFNALGLLAVAINGETWKEDKDMSAVSHPLHLPFPPLPSYHFYTVITPCGARISVAASTESSLLDQKCAFNIRRARLFSVTRGYPPTSSQ